MERNSSDISLIDETLAEVIASSAISSIDEVLAVLQGLDRVLPNWDGLKWFNLLYLKVTEGVRTRPPAEGWEDAPWLEQLDVDFAKLYVSALAAWQRNPREVSRSWAPLLKARLRRDVMRVQFALAGMNAHINHDLPLAVVQTGKQLHVTPRRGTPQYRDFERVNTLLEVVEAEVKQYLATGIIGEADEVFGQVDDAIAMWSVRKARDTAWTNAEILWHLRSLPIPSVGDDFLFTLDRLVSLGTQGLLVPVVLR